MKNKIIILMLIFLLTGCYGYQELNEKAIVKGISIDFEKNQYVVNYMVSNANVSNGKNSETNPQTALLEGKGDTISEAVAEINLLSPKKTYIGHMLILVISDELAKNGVATPTDYFFRNTQSKKSFYFVLSKGNKAKEILSILSPLNTFPAENITENLATSDLTEGFISNITFTEFISDILSDGVDPVLNGIKMIGSSESGSKKENLESSEIKNYIKIDTLGIFKKDKLIGFASKTVSKGINILNQKSDNFQIETILNDKKVVFRFKDIKVKKEVSFDDKITFKFKVIGESEIEETNGNFNISKGKDIKLLKESLDKKLMEILTETINYSKETKADFLGLGNYIYLNHYKKWKKIKDNFDLKNIVVKLEVNNNLLRNYNTNEGTRKVHE
ncbi:MAG: Ger(x)C family spore germination protein [Erysipelotrichaceae bacterium]|nr:Ger(x)C family spore germination protein [Erysipelotrichaceae bacterium]